MHPVIENRRWVNRLDSFRFFLELISKDVLERILVACRVRMLRFFCRAMPLCAGLRPVISMGSTLG
jgi:hypothetical protein